MYLCFRKYRVFFIIIINIFLFFEVFQEDPDFLCDASNLSYEALPLERKVKWLRAYDVAVDQLNKLKSKGLALTSRKPRLNYGGMNANAIRQGRVGSCFFLSAVGSLANSRVVRNLQL